MLLKKLFEKATQQILLEKWGDLTAELTWQDVLPYPESEIFTHLGSFSFWGDDIDPDFYKEKDELIWKIWATEFINSKKDCIRHNLNEIQRHLTDELAVWNRHHPEKNEYLTFDKIYQDWLFSIKDLSLEAFCKLPVGIDTVHRLIKRETNKLIKRYKMNVQSYTATPPNLSQRQVALLHIYQNKTINRGEEANRIAENHGNISGEKLYKFYNKLSHINNRMGVEGKEIIPFIKDISAVIPFLNAQQKKQAEDELKIVSAKI